MTDTTNNEQPEVKPGELDPEIWNNPTLGAATNSIFLDELELQQRENRNAAIEERPARIVRRENRYPAYEPENPNTPSVEFADTYSDGSTVVPVVPPNEDGYTRAPADYKDNSDSEEKPSNPGTASPKTGKVESKPVEKKTTS